jgi:hypothetical protein
MRSAALVRDSGPADGADDDSQTPCGVEAPSWPVSPTHEAELITPQVVLHDEVTSSDQVLAAFVDDLGLIVFTSGHVLRSTLEGVILSDAPYPAAPDALALDRITQGNTNYGAESASGFLCMIAKDGSVSPGTCSSVKPPAGPASPAMAWDDGKYLTCGLWDWQTNTMKLSSFDTSGKLLEDHTFAGATPNMAPGRLLPSADRLVIAYSAYRANCDSQFTDSLPWSLDTSTRTITEVTPAGFCFQGEDRLGVSSNRIAWLGLLQCDHSFADGRTAPVFSSLSMLNRDGTLVDGGIRPIPGRLWRGTIWDGERFVAMGYNPTANYFFVHTFAEDGNLQAQAVRVPFVPNDPREAANNGVIVAVGPNDYIAILNVPISVNSFVRFRLKL